MYNVGWVVGGVIVDFSYWLEYSASCGHCLTGVVRKGIKTEHYSVKIKRLRILVS